MKNFIRGVTLLLIISAMYFIMPPVSAENAASSKMDVVSTIQADWPSQETINIYSFQSSNTDMVPAFYVQAVPESPVFMAIDKTINYEVFSDRHTNVARSKTTIINFTKGVRQ